MTVQCPICRDLQPVDCPGCGKLDIHQIIQHHGSFKERLRPERHRPSWIDKLNANTPRMDAETCLVHAMAGDVEDEDSPNTGIHPLDGGDIPLENICHELFRSIGEPWHGMTADYPDKYGYYPGCNEG